MIGSPRLLEIGSHSERPGQADIPALMFGPPVRCPVHRQPIVMIGCKQDGGLPPLSQVACTGHPVDSTIDLPKVCDDESAKPDRQRKGDQEFQQGISMPLMRVRDSRVSIVVLHPCHSWLVCVFQNFSPKRTHQMFLWKGDAMTQKKKAAVSSAAFS